MTFASSLESVSAWRRTRLPCARFLPLAALLVWAAASGGHASVAATAVAFTTALSLIAQFRLWDDLVDRGRDATAHPQRIIVRAVSRAPFAWSVAGLGAANAIALMWAHGAPASLAFLLLCALTALWYAAHRERRLVHLIVLHLKYPAFVLLLAPMFSAQVAPLAAAAIVYAALIGFELLDQPRSRAREVAALRYLPFALAAIGLTFVTLGGSR